MSTEKRGYQSVAAYFAPYPPSSVCSLILHTVQANYGLDISFPSLFKIVIKCKKVRLYSRKISYVW